MSDIQPVSQIPAQCSEHRRPHFAKMKREERAAEQDAPLIELGQGRDSSDHGGQIAALIVTILFLIGIVIAFVIHHH